MSFTGFLKTFRSEKGFGYITPDNGSEDIFFHLQNVSNGGDVDMVPGARLKFDVGVNERNGMMKATAIHLDVPGTPNNQLLGGMAGMGSMGGMAMAGMGGMGGMGGMDMASMMAMAGLGDMGGGYGAAKGGKAKGTSPYGKGGMQNNFGGTAALPDFKLVVPATPVEVEQFLQLNPVEEHAMDMFRNMDSRGQRFVINRGQMSGARDATAAFIGRMKSVMNIINGGAILSPGDWLCPSCGHSVFARNNNCGKCGFERPESAGSHLKHTVPATPMEVEQFLILNPVEQHAADKFRKMDPKGQRLAINKGGLEGSRDPTAAFIGRLSQIDKIVRGTLVLPPGDWICPGCGDHQFSRNETCRRCSTPKPPNAGGEAAAAPAEGMDLMQAAMAQQMAGAMTMTPEMQLLMAQMAMAQQGMGMQGMASA